MTLLPFFIFAAALTAFLTAGWTAVPLIAFALAPTRIRSYFLDSADNQRLYTEHPHQMEMVSRLRQMGFTLMGVRAEQPPLWGKRTVAIALADPSTQTYASILFVELQNRPLLYFFTPLRNGGMIYTRNLPTGPLSETPEVSVKNILNNDLGLIYDDHLSRVRQRQVPASMLFDVTRREERHEASRLFYATAYGRTMTRKLLKSRTVRTFAITAVILLLATIFLLR